MISHRRLAIALATLTLLPGIVRGADVPRPVPALKEQHRVRQEWLKARLERVLPVLMRRHGVSMWIVANREYNEDPVFLSLVSPSLFAARRRTILVFFDRGPEKGVERLALGGGSNGGLYTVYRDPEVESRELWGQAQWVMLRKIVDERKPSTIALDISHTHAFSDGLSAGEREQLEAALGPWVSRVVRAENLPLEYLSIRVPEMLPAYRDLMRISHGLIARAFSNEVITPGRTTTEDVEWWLRQQVNDLGLGGNGQALPSAAEILAGHQQIVARAHTHGIKVIVGTFLPFEGTNLGAIAPGYYSAEKDARRREINDVIRKGTPYDGVIDFETVVRDPGHPLQLLAKFKGADNLHLTDAGYEAMAGAVNLALLRR